MSEEKWCPTRGGTYTAYEPEYEDKDGTWRSVPTTEIPAPYAFAAFGVQPPRYCGGITRELGLFGRAQAWALAWQYAAQVDTQGEKAVRVRVAQYEVKYDLKARRLEIPLSTGE